MEEIWKDIEGYEGYYKISNRGKVITKHYRNKYSNIEKELTLIDNKKGYLRVTLKGKKYYIHQLVAKEFIDNPKNYKEVNHIDGNTYNNVVENLEWCNHKENMIHAVNKLGKCNSKKVKCVDVKTRKEKIYNSINSATKDGFKNSGINRSIKNNIKHHGYKWFLISEEE